MQPGDETRIVSTRNDRGDGMDDPVDQCQTSPGDADVVGNGGPADHKPYLTCWLPLDDTTIENGTIRLQPFSKLPESRERILPHRRQARSNDLVGWHGEDPGISLDVVAGSVVAFSSLLLQATGANQTSKLRRVYLAQYSPEVILNPGTRQLRRDAVPLLQHSNRVTLP